MNRKQRRVQKAQARKSQGSVNHIVAAHEAGHAVARYLTADEMGYTPEEAISKILISTPGTLRQMGTSFDGRADLYSQAVTYGPMLSREMHEAARAALEDAKETGLNLPRIVSEARANGANIEAWLRARTLIAVMGPAVEAMIKGMTVAEVLESYESENDLAGCVKDCQAAHVSDFAERIDEAIARACKYLSRQSVCGAVNALAAHLVKNGTTDGATAARIIETALKGD